MGEEEYLKRLEERGPTLEPNNGGAPPAQFFRAAGDVLRKHFVPLAGVIKEFQPPKE